MDRRHALIDLAATTDCGDGIIEIRLPMTGNPMRYINGYVVEDESGLSLIDTGWKADDVLAALHAGLREYGFSLRQIARLLITHCHFDHYGLAGTLRRAGVPELGMHVRDSELAREYLSDPIAIDAAADAWIERNGLCVDTALDEELQHHRTEVAEPTFEISDGQRIGRLRALWTPGHTPGHLCFVDERTGAMFSGDHILDPITPHVAIWRPGNPDPLGDYIASLHVVANTGASRVFPAHGEPFPDLARRVEQLLAHEAQREERVLAALAHGPRSAADVARALSWTRRERRFGELGATHQQFAVAETLAHLEHLRGRNAVTRDDAGPTIIYRGG